MKQSAHYWSMPLVLATGILFSLPLASVAQQRDTFFVFRQAAPNTQPQGLPLSENLSLNLDSSELGRLREASPQNMRMALPTSQGTKVFSMYKVELLHPDFRLLNQANQALPFEKGLTYQGRIAGEEGAFITCTFLKDRVLGNLALESGSYVLGSEPTGPARTHRLSRETIDENEPLDLRCGDNTLIPTGFSPPSLKADTGIAAQAVSLSSKMINVHFDCDYALYTYLGSSETTVLNYVVSLFNVVHALYRNEGILVRIRSIRVWTTTDPYASAASTTATLYALGNEYRDGLPTGSNMVHLLSRRNLGGGIAWRSSGPGLLCRSPYYSTSNNAYVGPFAVSANLSTSFSSFPAYSWSVNVVTHEMGHNIGSPHTHSCDWTGGALDNCYTTEGGCAPGPAPTNGGTIMSYCHLVPGVGINFNNGFGTPPGNLIRSNVAAETCLTTTAEAQINTSTSDIALGSPSGSTTLAVTTSPGTLYWNVSDNADWLSLSSITGQGNATLTLTYTANSGSTSRSALVTLVSENVSRTVIVTQSPPASTPTVTTTAISSITTTTAGSGGNVTAQGGSAVTARGVVWSSSPNPTIALATQTSNGTGTGTFSSSISGLAAGTTYYVRAYATNSAGTAYGNEVSFTTIAALPTLSTTAISAITTASASSGGTISSDGGAAITARGVVWSPAPNPTIALATQTSNGTGTGTFSSSISGLAAGTTYYVRAYATNSAGTAYGNELSFTTNSPPTVTTTAVSGISGTSATGGGNVTAQGSSAVTARGVVWSTSPNPTISLSSKTSDGSGTGAFTSSISGLATGTTYYVRAYATNNTGTAYGSQVSFTALNIPTISSFSPASGLSGTAVLIKGTNLSGATAVSFGGVAAASFSVVDSATITARVGSGASGAVSVTTPTGTGSKSGFTYSTSAVPTISSFSPVSAAPDQIVVLNGSNFTGASSVTFGGVAAKSFWVNSATKITAIVGTGASGSIVVTTPGGTASRAGFTFVPTSAPDVTAFTPLSARSNQTVTIQGTNFNGISAVTFGGVAARSFNRVSSTVVTAVVGSGATGHIAVTGSGGVDSLAGFTFISAPPPSMRSFSPTSAATGNIVQIKGTAFSGATAVTFGGTAAAFSVTSDSTINATVGSGASGNVKVTTPGGSSSRGGFSYVIMTNPPTITSFTPASARQGQTVTITGNHFTGASSVTFGGTAAKSFSVVNATTIVAVVASGASGNVAVGTPAGTATSSGTFTYISALPPTISNFSPTSAANGNTVVITGTNLTGASSVQFGGVAATSFTVNSATSISAVVSNGASGSVSVTTPGGTATRSGFVYAAAAAPSISSFAPTTAFTGKTVTISGSGFLGATAVTFGGVNAKSFTVLSSTTIVATVGSGASGSVNVSSPMGTGSRTGFTFSPPPVPVIAAFAPGSASTDQVVVISGSNFSGGWANVRFGGTLAKSASVLNDSTIAATVGNGSSGNVIVTTAGGTATLAGFVYIPPGPPAISSFSPTTAGNGNTVLIRGSNFKGWANVSFGGTAAKSVSVVDSTLIVAVVGSGASGSVRVTTGGGYAERTGFTYSSSTLQPAGYTPGEDSGQHRSDTPDTAGAGQDQRIRVQPGLELPDQVRMLLYPNPSDGVVNLQINTPEDSPNGCQLRILDALGRELKRMDRLQSGSYTVELSGSPAGLYYFVLFDSGQIPVASQRVLLR